MRKPIIVKALNTHHVFYPDDVISISGENRGEIKSEIVLRGSTDALWSSETPKEIYDKMCKVLTEAEKPEKVEHGDNCNHVDTCCPKCYQDWLDHKKDFKG